MWSARAGEGSGGDGLGEKGTYEERGHDPVRLRELLNAELLRQGEHDVEQDQEAWCFHCRPADGAGDVEAGVDGGLALRVVVEQPLRDGDLGSC